MNILCVCTSGKDRSPIMAEYCREKGHEASAAGINEHRTELARTDHFKEFRYSRMDKILVVSNLHAAYVRGFYAGWNESGRELVGGVDIQCPPIVVVPGLEGSPALTDEQGDILVVPDFRGWVRSCMDKVKL